MRLAGEFLDGKSDVGTCALCLKEGVPLTDEHIFPQSLGGKIICKFLCGRCNTKMGVIDREFDCGMLPRLNHIVSRSKGKISPREFLGCFQGKTFDAVLDVAPPLEGCKIAYEIACSRFGLRYVRNSKEAGLLRRALFDHREQDVELLVLPLLNHELPELEYSIGMKSMWATEFWGLSVVSVAGVVQGVITEKSDDRFRTSVDDATLYLSPYKKGCVAEALPLKKWYESHHLDIGEVNRLLKKLS